MFADFTAGQEKEMKALHLNLAQIEERVGRLTDAYIDSVIDKSYSNPARRNFLKNVSPSERKSATCLWENPISTRGSRNSSNR